jgi:hypothetical protein
VLFTTASLSLGVLGERPASAQAEDQAAARALFSEGRRLAEAGQVAEACPKFEAARKLYTSAGILLNLGDCYEKTGRTASAWTTFGEAISVASRSNRGEDAAEAKKRQTKLEPQLTRVVLHITRETPGLVIRRDGSEVPRAAWDAAIPVDPGAHTFRAEAAGYAPWTRSVAAGDPGKSLTVEVPALVEAPAPEATRAPPSGPATAAGQPAKPAVVAPVPENNESAGPPGATQRILGLAIGGAGIVGMGVAGVLGLVAKSQYDSAQNETTNRHNDSVSAGQLADVATVVLIGGGVLTAAGAVIWITAPTGQVAVGTNGRGVFAVGSF